MVQIIVDGDMYQELLDQHANTNVTLVFKFGASWCGPCKRIEPHYDTFAKENNSNVEYYHLDIDEESISDIMEDLELQLVPHFLIIRNKKVISTKQTSNKDELIPWLLEHI